MMHAEMVKREEGGFVTAVEELQIITYMEKYATDIA